MTKRVRRNANFINIADLTRLVTVIPSPQRLESYVAGLKDKLERDGLEGSAGNHLFAEHVDDYRGIAPAFLREKAPRVRAELVECGGTSVRSLCRKLVHAGEDDMLLDVAVEAWESWGDSSSLDGHAAELDRLRCSKDENIRAFAGRVLSGHHDIAYAQLKDQLLAGASVVPALLLLLRQTHLFLFQDVQRLAADLHQSSREPLRGLVERIAGNIRGTGIRTILRPMLKACEQNLLAFSDREERNEDRRRRIAERTDPSRPVRPAEKRKPRGTLSRIIAMLVKPRLKSITPRDAVKVRRNLDALLPMCRRDLAKYTGVCDNEFLRLVGKDRLSRAEREKLNRPVSAWRYSDMTPVTCLAVAVARLVQAERHLQEELDRCRSHLVKNGRLPETIRGTLPPFDRTLLTSDEKYRIRRTLDEYRRLVLADGAHRSQTDNYNRAGKRAEPKRPRSGPLDPGDRQGQKEIDKAFDFLERVGARKPQDRYLAAGDERHTLYLLDVFPDFRLNGAAA